MIYTTCAKSIHLGNKQGRVYASCLALLLIFIVSVLAIINWGQRNHILPSRPGLARIAERTQIKFPGSARVLNSHEGGGVTAEILAKIEIDRSDAEAFHKQFQPTEYSDPKTVMIALGHFSGGDWWNPTSMKRYLSFNKKVGVMVWGAVSLDDKDKSVIYVERMAK